MIIVICQNDCPEVPKKRWGQVYFLSDKILKNTAYRNDSYYLYDKKGQLSAYGPTDLSHNRIKTALLRILNNDYFDPLDFAKELQSKDIDDIREVNSRYYVLLTFFQKFCSTCRNGDIIRRLVELSAEKGELIYVMAFLNSTRYSEQDRNALISQSNVNFQTYLSGNDLTAMWQQYSNKYGSDSLDGFLILFQSGEAIKAADSACACDGQFFAFLYGLEKKGGSGQ